jgi:hypothetical protein
MASRLHNVVTGNLNVTSVNIGGPMRLSAVVSCLFLTAACSGSVDSPTGDHGSHLGGCDSPAPSPLPSPAPWTEPSPSPEPWSEPAPSPSPEPWWEPSPSPSPAPWGEPAPSPSPSPDVTIDATAQLSLPCQVTSSDYAPTFATASVSCRVTGSLTALSLSCDDFVAAAGADGSFYASNGGDAERPSVTGTLTATSLRIDSYARTYLPWGDHWELTAPVTVALSPR